MAGFATTMAYSGNRKASANNYLFGDQYFISPSSYENGINSIFQAVNGAELYASDNTSKYVRPVINLKADTTVTPGDGTKDNPYVVE